MIPRRRVGITSTVSAKVVRQASALVFADEVQARFGSMAMLCGLLARAVSPVAQPPT